MILINRQDAKAHGEIVLEKVAGAK